MRAFILLLSGLVLMGNGMHDPYMISAGISSIALAGYLAGG